MKSGAGSRSEALAPRFSVVPVVRLASRSAASVGATSHRATSGAQSGSPPEEYRAGHVPGALSIPVGELKARSKELPKGREVVASCRGPYCVMAVEAVELLRKKGFEAQRMEQGVVAWRARGWCVRDEGGFDRRRSPRRQEAQR